MLIINKKAVLILSIFIILILIIFRNSEVIETSALPIRSHTVILDAGHGLPDGGAIASDGTSEERINLAITLKTKTLLESSGCKVILTRSTENGIYDTNAKNRKKSDLLNRLLISQNSNADIFISIHLNKINDPNCYGWQTFYQNNNKNSKSLAKYIQENLNTSIDKTNNRKILPLSGKFIMDNIKIPTVTVECGFLSNDIELKLLKSESYQEKLAWGIYEGIIDYFSNSML